jgi:lysophospholipase
LGLALICRRGSGYGDKELKIVFPGKTIISMNFPFNFVKTTDAVTIRHGFWPSGREISRATVLLLNGRTEFMEKHLETVQELTQRGMNVHSLDWRGQGGSSRLLPNPQKGYVNSYEDYVRDLSFFYRCVLGPDGAQKPLIILAHSMGGHIALRFLHQQPAAAERMVLLSPMIDIHTDPLPGWFARAITRVAMTTGLAGRYCLGAGDYSASREKFHNNLLTSDPERFYDAQAAITAAPHLATGGVTWGWLSATFRSIDILSEPGYVKRIRTPVLMVCAQNDRIVTRKAQETISSQLPDSRLMVIPEARHEILKESDAVRAVFWDAFDRFVDMEIR